MEHRAARPDHQRCPTSQEHTDSPNQDQLAWLIGGSGLSHSGGSTEGGARVYRVKPAKVIAFGDTHGQTTYRF